MGRRAVADDRQRGHDGALALGEGCDATADDAQRDLAGLGRAVVALVDGRRAMGRHLAPAARPPATGCRARPRGSGGRRRSACRARSGARSDAPPVVSASGRRTVVAAASRSRLSRSAGAPGSSAPRGDESSSGRSAIRRAKNASTSSDERSAHCASSTTRTSGRSSARPEHSHSRLCATSVVASAPGTVPSSSSSPARPATPSSSRARAAGPASRTGDSSRARITP